MLLKLTQLNGQEIIVNMSNVISIKPGAIEGSYTEFIKRYSYVNVKEEPDEIINKIRIGAVISV